MADIKITNPEEQTLDAAASQAVAKVVFGESDNRPGQGGQRGGQRGNQRGGRGKGNDRGGRGGDDMDQRMLDVARVTRVMKGGKRMSFRACVAIGDKKGTVGIGLGKGADVTLAVNKAVNQAKKKLIKVSLINDTIPHALYETLGAAKILFKPAAKGRGVKAGGVVRLILELAGVKNISSKILGTNNKINNARCTISALSKLRLPAKVAKIQTEKITTDK